MTRLWDKGEALNERVHAFTVGDDPVWDKQLLRWDAIGSAAQARMLQKIGVLTEKECEGLLRALREVLERADRNDFEIASFLEDGHTAIEAFLTEKVGEAGKKIHTGRSRNDQVMVCIRLYMRHIAVVLMSELVRCGETLAVRFSEIGEVSIPGYTHLQPAMPSSFGMWLHANVEAIVDLLRDGGALLQTLDANPLGVASGYGVSLPLDREYTAELLQFSRVQRSPIDVQNSRGRHEAKLLRWLTDIGSVVEKIAIDLQLYSMKEFDFINLPVEFTTGSSIMPQKRNPDVLELLRSSVGKLRGASEELSWVVAKLPSGYHRDYQHTKAPVLRAVQVSFELLPIVREVLSGFSVNEEACAEAMTPELFATFDAYAQVEQGIPFREAYQKTAEEIKSENFDSTAYVSHFQKIADETKRDFVEATKELAQFKTNIEQTFQKFQKIEQTIF